MLSKTEMKFVVNGNSSREDCSYLNVFASFLKEDILKRKISHQGGLLNGG